MPIRRNSVTAFRPFAITAIRCRFLGSRPMGASIRAAGSATSPTTIARYLRVMIRPWRSLVPRPHRQTRGVAVQPVNNPRPLGTPDRRPAGAAAEQAMDQGAGRMARPGMHDEAGRFVDDDQVVVLVEHPKIHRFRLQLGWAGFG